VAGVPTDLFVGRQTHYLLRVTTWVIASGHDDGTRYLDQTDYSGFNDPITITLPSVTPSPARAGHTAVRLSGGRVLVVGGLGPDLAIRTGWIELYDPRAGTWSRADPPSVPLFEPQAVAMRGGHAVISGGFFPVVSDFGSQMIFAPATNTWRIMPAPRVTCRYPVSAALKDGRLLEAGGLKPGTRRSVRSAELYYPATGTWSQTGSMK
jgi:hypothetical protein